MVNYAPFDAAEYLDSEEAISEFLAAAMEDPDPAVFLSAIGAVARFRGMAKVAADAGLGRESLYKALAPGAHPRYETIQKVVQALGVRISITPAR
jgi:probable addiction module antidote protein